MKLFSHAMQASQAPMFGSRHIVPIKNGEEYDACSEAQNAAVKALLEGGADVADILTDTKGFKTPPGSDTPIPYDVDFYKDGDPTEYQYKTVGEFVTQLKGIIEKNLRARSK